MASEPVVAPACCFCGGTVVALTHEGLRHPFVAAHGPFRFHRCVECGSGLTLPPPSRESLADLYGSYRDGRPDLHREITRDDPQSALYRLCVRRVRRTLKSAGADLRTWIDVGAGTGELSRIIAHEFPGATGVAVDLHDRPAALEDVRRVAWRRVDVNGEDFAREIGGTAQLVISTSVWEHVLAPDRFARELLRTLEPGGVLHLLAPDYGSAASRMMGRRWPYFTPGEHLNMPTVAGARRCLARQWRAVHAEAPAPVIRIERVWLPYTLRYVLRRLGMDAIGRLLPPGSSLPLPVGALESVLLSPTGREAA